MSRWVFVDGQHTLGADDSDFQAVHRAGHTLGSAQEIEAWYRLPVLEDDHARGRIDAAAQRAQGLVDRARVDSAGFFASIIHMTTSSACVPEITSARSMPGRRCAR